jgi:hypothetical protein
MRRRGGFRRGLRGVKVGGPGHHYAHILPDGEEFLNILEPFRDEFVGERDAGKLTFRLSDLPHLNSSQEMGINLAFPFIFCGWHLPLLAALEVDSEPIESSEFERRMPDRTNVDVFLRRQSGRELFCEIKLAETGFGTANDANAVYEEIFRNLHPQLEAVVGNGHLNLDNFEQYYQLFRYLALIAPDQPHIFCPVIPRRNRPFHNSRIAFMEQVVQPVVRQKVKISYLEDVIERLLASTQSHERIQRHFLLFKELFATFDL